MAGFDPGGDQRLVTISEIVLTASPERFAKEARRADESVVMTGRTSIRLRQLGVTSPSALRREPQRRQKAAKLRPDSRLAAEWRTAPGAVLPSLSLQCVHLYRFSYRCTSLGRTSSPMTFASYGLTCYRPKPYLQVTDLTTETGCDPRVL